MKFLVLLWALYLGQCLTHLTRGTALFDRSGRLPSNGPGWRLHNLRPSARLYFGERLPWIWHRGRLRWRGVASRLLASDLSTMDDDAPELESATPAKADGAVVRIAGVAGVRCMSEAGAEAIVSVLERAGEGVDSPRRAVESLLGSEMSSDRFRGRRSELEANTKWLRWHLDLYAVVLLVALPVQSLIWGIEAVLWLMTPVLLGLHVLGVTLFAFAHRRLRPARTGALVQSIFELAVYPPSVLRSFQKLQAETIGRHHPGVIAVEILADEPRREVLRRELVRVVHTPVDDGGTWFRATELHALECLADAAGAPRAELLAPPSRVDERAAAYCPACLAEYDRPGCECSECRIDVVLFPNAPGTF